MELSKGQTAGIHEIAYNLDFFVDENTYWQYEWRQLGHDLLNHHGINVSRALPIEDESERISTSRHGNPGIFDIRDSTNFCSICHRRLDFKPL